MVQEIESCNYWLEKTTSLDSAELWQYWHWCHMAQTGCYPIKTKGKNSKVLWKVR